jgi:hypothetical protein
MRRRLERRHLERRRLELRQLMRRQLERRQRVLPHLAQCPRPHRHLSRLPEEAVS